MKKYWLLLIAIFFLSASVRNIYSEPKQVTDQVYLFERLTIANNGSNPYIFKEPIGINVPLNDTFQKSHLVNISVYLNGTKFLNFRKSFLKDKCNNTEIIFYINKIPPKSYITIEILYYVRVKRFKPLEVFSFSNSGKISDIPYILKKKYTKSEGVWLYKSRSMNYLAVKAREIIGNDDNVLRIVSKLVDYIWTKIQYRSFYRPRYPNETLPLKKMSMGLGEGDCDDQSNLLILMLRSLGIPSFLVVGFVGDFDYGADRTEYNVSAHYYYSFKGIDMMHGWVNAYIPPWGWVPVDLTVTASKDSFFFSVNTSLVSEYWRQYKIIPVKYVKICHQDYIKKNIEETVKNIMSPLYYYEEYAIIDPRDNVSRIKNIFNPLPLPWIKKTNIEIKVPSSINILKRVNIKGYIVPKLSNQPLSITIKKPSGKVIKKKVLVQNGTWNLTIFVDEPGLWTVNASFYGSNKYTPAFTSKQFLVKKLKTKLLVNVFERSNKIIVNGSILPVIENATLYINMILPNGSKEDIKVMTNNKGIFHYEYNITIPGEWKIIVAWLGNKYYEYSINSSYIFVKLPVVIKMHSLPKKIYENSIFTLEGCLVPQLSGQNITVYLKSNNGEQKNFTLLLDKKGCFSTVLSLSLGKWDLLITFQGNEKYYNYSIKEILNVNKKRSNQNYYYMILVIISILVLIILYKKKIISNQK